MNSITLFKFCKMFWFLQPSTWIVIGKYSKTLDDWWHKTIYDGHKFTEFQPHESVINGLTVWTSNTPYSCGYIWGSDCCKVRPSRPVMLWIHYQMKKHKNTQTKSQEMKVKEAIEKRVNQ